jgi:hypothetical protein
MAALNRAYALVLTPELRAAHDRERSRLRPVGPGFTAPEAPPQRLPASHAPFARAAERTGRGGELSSPVLDFGRYVGWSLPDLARHDPDYLRWLSRHSAGLRFRDEIQGLLPNEPT